MSRARVLRLLGLLIAGASCEQSLTRLPYNDGRITVGDGGWVLLPDGGLILPDGGTVDLPDGGVACVYGGSQVVICVEPIHAPAICPHGKCGHGPCAPGWFDFDREILGCESSCTDKHCTFVDGGEVVLTDVPVNGFETMASGSSFGSALQTSAQATNMGILGEPTPPVPEGGPVVQSGEGLINVGGFNALQH